MNEREFAIHSARVYLAEASRRRDTSVNRFFYWTLIAMARKQRLKAVTLAEPQRSLFA